MLRWLGYVRSVVVLLVSVTLVLVGHMIADIVFLAGKPFLSKDKFYSMAHRFYSWISLVIWETIIFKFNAIQMTLAGDKFDRNDPAFVISNHVQSCDMGYLNTLANHWGPGAGALRYMVKESVIYLPFFGLCHYFLNDLFLKRNWTQDESRIETYAKRFGWDQSRWMLVFPEGTRSAAKSKQVQSREFAEQHNLPVLKHVLYPRKRGFVALVQHFQKQGNVKFLYDVTLCYPFTNSSFVPSAVWHILGRVKFAVTVHVRKIPLASLPRDEDGLGDYLYKLFQQKDALIEDFVRNNYRLPAKYGQNVVKA